jgi:hypothetical protein
MNLCNYFYCLPKHHLEFQKLNQGEQDPKFFQDVLDVNVEALTKDHIKVKTII